MSQPVTIKILPDGPLQVSGAGSLNYCGEPLSVEGDTVYLCRCGESANAPFCDGSHARVGFSGAKEATGEKPIRVWEGNTLRTYFNPNACMHVFYCKPLKELRERELAGDVLAGEEIKKVVGTCPSGALTWESTIGDSIVELPSHAADIDIVEGGEVRVQCAFDIDTPLLERQDGVRATLCRCGASKNKPWCDGRHRKRRDFK